MTHLVAGVDLQTFPGHVENVCFHPGVIGVTIIIDVIFIDLKTRAEINPIIVSVHLRWSSGPENS